MKAKKGSIKKSIKKFISKNILFLSYIILSILTEIFLRISTVGGHFYLKALWADIAIVLFLGSFGYLFKPKNRFGYYFALLFFYVGLCVANVIYYQFYTSYISVDLLATASMVGQVDDSLFAKMHIKHFAFLIFLVIFVLIHKRLKKNNYYKMLEESEESIKYKNVVIPIFVIVVFLLSISVSDIGKYAKKWNRENILRIYGIQGFYDWKR